MERKLLRASLDGSVPDLEALIEQDELVLDRVSLTCFHETPLHIAALRGHLDFAKALLRRKPKLATELDSQRCLPLHLAAAEGHLEVVRELLQANSNVTCSRDQDGRTPLHLAAIKGRVEVIHELARVKPGSINERLETGETVLHLCVWYNRLDALKALVLELPANNTELVNSKDHRGNTILHLAVALKRMDTIKYLLGIEIVGKNINAKNEDGFTALDILDSCLDKDLKSMEISEFLLQADAQRGNHKNLQQQHSPPNSTPSVALPSPQTRFSTWEWISKAWSKYLAPEPNWFREIRGHLITAATLTATIAYQSVLSPPGGFWQESEKQDYPTPQNETQTNNTVVPGKAISAYEEETYYFRFLSCNTYSFVASLCVILLSLTGLPYRNKLFLYTLLGSVVVALASITAAYGYALKMTIPQSVEKWHSNFINIVSTFVIWSVVIIYFYAFHASRFLVWLGKKCWRLGGKIARSMRRPGASESRVYA